MKKILNIALAAVLLLGVGSCNDWLDINVNPNSPTSVTAPVANRLPWLQYAYNYAYGNASASSTVISGQMASNSSNSAYAAYAPGTGAGPTTPYQQWFVGGACNIMDLVNKANEEKAYHYIGAAYTIHAMGFMLMLDYYGEMPYTEALTASLSPKYDDGKTIFEGCLAKLDSALVYFQKTQPSTATPLSAGDSWNGGDVQKWIKLCYGLKARWLNNLVKKSGLYNADAILAAVEKGPNSNDASTIIHHVNDPGDNKGSDLLGVGDPMKTSFIFDVVSWGTAYRISQRYLNALANPRNSGVEDPRIDRLVPSSQHHRMVPDPSNPGQMKEELYLERTKGVDIINTNIRVNGSGPLHPSYSTTTKKWTVSSSNADRLGDTVYVLMTARCAMQGVTTGEGTYLAADGTIMSTGTFYSLPESQTDVMTYHEMCFIKAEVLFRKGDKAGALTAYKEGVRAHMALMQSKLRQWGTTGVNPYKRPMDDAAIAAFLDGPGLVQNAGDLTMAEIMGQKFIAMSFTLQNWNDVRKYDYSNDNGGSIGVVYPGLERPYEFTVSPTSAQYFPGSAKSDPSYWFRRMKQCSHEINYNSKNLVESNPKAMAPEVYSIPVWWDVKE